MIGCAILSDTARNDCLATVLAMAVGQMARPTGVFLFPCWINTLSSHRATVTTTFSKETVSG